MINKIWFGISRFYLILLPLSWIYGLITNIIRFSYRYGLRKVYYFPLPIVVVGNLTVGGNGKTPMVIWLVTKLQQLGFRVGVISRGYGGHSNRYPLLINNSTTSDQCGDEPLMIWQRTGVPVAVAHHRPKAVMTLLHTNKLDVIIADDGLQHYALGRDIEWIVIDGERRFGNGCWLPAGPMRERSWRLKTVNAVIVNGGCALPGEISMRLITSLIAINLLSGEYCMVKNLSPIVAIAGIGYPYRFFTTLHTIGITPIKEISFKDHQTYRQSMLDTLVKPDEQLLMTEKDGVKCRAFARINWWYLPVDVELRTGGDKCLLEPILQMIECFPSRVIRK